MEKIFLTDGSGKFFDLESVEYIYKTKLEEEDDPEQEEVLYNTKREGWVLVTGAMISGQKTVEQLSPEDAAQWFDDNGYDFEDVPDDLQEYLGEEI